MELSITNIVIIIILLSLLVWVFFSDPLKSDQTQKKPLPINIIRTQPASTITTQPASTITTQPASTITTQPASTITTQPASTIRTATPRITKAPTPSPTPDPNCFIDCDCGTNLTYIPFWASCINPPQVGKPCNENQLLVCKYFQDSFNEAVRCSYNCDCLTGKRTLNNPDSCTDPSPQLLKILSESCINECG